VTRTTGGIEYRIDGRESGWTFLLRTKAPGARYFVNGRLAAAANTVVRLRGRRNVVLMVPRD
jgi:hypothetical protein